MGLACGPSSRGVPGRLLSDGAPLLTEGSCIQLCSPVSISCVLISETDFVFVFFKGGFPILSIML